MLQNQRNNPEWASCPEFAWPNLALLTERHKLQVGSHSTGTREFKLKG